MSETVGSQGLDAETIKKLLDGSYGEATPPGWKKDNRLSTNQQKVYIHELSGKVVVSHRGTVGTAQDWFNNAMYGVFGDRGYELTGRYKKAKKTQEKAEKKYGAENVTTIGHSQGGLLAQKVGGDSAEIITLNKATRPQDFFQRKRGEKQTDIRTEGDVVSMFKNPFETQGKQVTIKTDKFNPLAEHATDVLDRLKADKAADQAPEWSTKSRPPGTMISRVGRLISKSFLGRGPKYLEGGMEHIPSDPEQQPDWIREYIRELREQEERQRAAEQEERDEKTRRMRATLLPGEDPEYDPTDSGDERRQRRAEASEQEARERLADRQSSGAEHMRDYALQRFEEVAPRTDLPSRRARREARVTLARRFPTDVIRQIDDFARQPARTQRERERQQPYDFQENMNRIAQEFPDTAEGRRRMYYAQLRELSNTDRYNALIREANPFRDPQDDQAFTERRIEEDEQLIAQEREELEEIIRNRRERRRDLVSRSARNVARERLARRFPTEVIRQIDDFARRPTQTREREPEDADPNTRPRRRRRRMEERDYFR